MDNQRIAFFVLIFYTASALEPNLDATINDDIGLNITKYVPKYGYPLESHQIQTEDGYIITVHRIPHGRHPQRNDARGFRQRKPVALMMHGLLASSIDWVNSGPGRGLGFLLADAGYDVWLGNQRGNTWGKRHVTLDPVKNASKFWDFSVHEIGYYDIARKIDYIRQKTGADKILYVGHSQGNAAFYILMSTRPEYNKYIKLAVNLGPVAYLNHTTHPLVNLMASKLPLLQLGASMLKVYEILPHYKVITEIGRHFCVDGSPYQAVCADIIYLFAGYDPQQMNRSLIPIVTSGDPAGASVKQLFHFLQMRNSGQFRQYNYGLVGNLARYGQINPPNYNISKVLAPVILYSAKNDWFCNPKDVDRLASELPNLVKRFTVTIEDFSHLDYIWGKDAVKLVYKNIFKFF